MMNEITLTDVLNCREARAKLQGELLKTYGVPLISFTMNIAGPVKISSLIRRAFYFGIRALEEQLDKNAIIYKKVDEAKTGYEALYAYAADARDIKNICMSLEESLSIGRLFDMDVIDRDGTKPQRGATRGCIVCGAPGRACAAARVHSVTEIQAKTTQIMESFFKKQDSEKIGELAYRCLVDEVQTTPKPGLVDLSNTGSHSDMNLESFLKSAAVLRPYFQNCFLIGCNSAAASPQECFGQLKSAGILAEEAMFDATGGVNTHKGMIYSLGIVCGAIGRLWKAECPFADTEQIFSEAALLARDAAKADFQNPDGKTAGTRLYIERKITGIRGQVCEGFPAVRDLALPILQNALKQGATRNDAGILALLHLITKVEDTNLYHRGGEEGVRYAKDYAKKLCNLQRLPTKEEVAKMDTEFIQRKLSPGGCADLLAITYFFESLSRERV